MNRADADTAGVEGRPDAVPVVDVLETDELATDAVGWFIDEDAAGDGNAGSVLARSAAVRRGDLRAALDVFA